MAVSILTHYVEESQREDFAGLDYISWVVIDTLAASIMVMTVATYIAKIGGDIRTLFFIVTVIIELFLDLYFMENYDIRSMSKENIVFGIIGILLVGIRRQHIRSSRIQCIGITLLYSMSASFLVTGNDQTNAIMHSLFHVGMFGTTFLWYYLEERALWKADQDDDPDTPTSTQRSLSSDSCEVQNKSTMEKNMKTEKTQVIVEDLELGDDESLFKDPESSNSSTEITVPSSSHFLVLDRLVEDDDADETETTIENEDSTNNESEEETIDFEYDC